MIAVLLAFATWRFTHMLHDEAGPYKVFERLRTHIIKMDSNGTWVNESSILAQLFVCFKCLSVWVAAPFAIYAAKNIYEFVFYLLALSGIAILINEQIDS